MIRHQFSYWLEAEPKSDTADPAELLTAFRQSDLSDHDMIFEIKNRSVTGEIDPERGTVEQVGSVGRTVEKIAKRFPGFKITFTERDEEDKSVGCVVKYENGIRVFQGSIRTLDPDEYDLHTIVAIAAYLEKNGWDNAARAIQTEFQP